MMSNFAVTSIYGGTALPDCCVYCCRRATHYEKGKLQRRSYGGFKETRTTLSFRIPYCFEHYILYHRLVSQQFKWSIIFVAVFALLTAGVIVVQPGDVRENLMNPWSGAFLVTILSYYPIDQFVVPNLLARFNGQHRDLKKFGTTDTLGIGAQFNNSGGIEFDITNTEYFHRFKASNHLKTQNSTIEGHQPPDKPKRIWRNGRFVDNENESNENKSE